jgi:hypothetical protein
LHRLHELASRAADLILPLHRCAISLTQGPREQQLALPLLLLLGQQLRVIALQTESPHLKLVAELYDKASQTLLQVLLIDRHYQTLVGRHKIAFMRHTTHGCAWPHRCRCNLRNA